MIGRDWTITDQACAADDERTRRWWRADPFAEPDYRDGPDEAREGERSEVRAIPNNTEGES